MMLTLLAAPLFLVADTPHRPVAQSPEWNAAYTYFWTWVNAKGGLQAQPPMLICDWRPGSKIATLRVPTPTAWYTPLVPTVLSEIKGVKKRITYHDGTVATDPALQPDLDRALALCNAKPKS